MSSMGEKSFFAIKKAQKLSSGLYRTANGAAVPVR
jgi:hypothetical protein